LKVVADKISSGKQVVETRSDGAANWSKRRPKCITAAAQNFAGKFTLCEIHLICRWHVGCSERFSECAAKEGGNWT
jgi:hypothetical protein